MLAAARGNKPPFGYAWQRFVHDVKSSEKEKCGKHMEQDSMYDTVPTLRIEMRGTGDFHPRAAPFPPTVFRVFSPRGFRLLLNRLCGLPGGRG